MTSMTWRRVGCLGAVALIVGLGGCATVSDLSGVQQLLDYNRIDYDPDRGRAAFRAPLTPPAMICVEPSLDAALVFTNKILTENNLRAGHGRDRAEADLRTVELATKTQKVITLVRAAMSQLCEQWANGKVSPQEKISSYELALDASSELLGPTLAWRRDDLAQVAAK